MKTDCTFILLAFLAGALVSTASGAKAPAALAFSQGSEFQGGAKDLFGSSFDGEQVNYVYAQPTGKHSRMEIKFKVDEVPRGPLFVHLKARDDDGVGACTVAIELNGKTLFEGRNGFAQDTFEQHRFPIPGDLLVKGENTLAVVNREKAGVVGMPPWFQVAGCAVGAAEYTIHRDPHRDFYVNLPAAKRPFPEPLPPGKSPGFKWRGTKGWMWRPDQYLEELRVLPEYKLNFLMNCYASMCDLEHCAWGDPNCNRWWEPLPLEKKQAYEQIVRECQERRIEFCFSMNPNLSSKRFVNDGKLESIDQLYQHYAWMQGLGVKWFNISLDDISTGIDASGQARMVNEILRRLRSKDPQAQMIFCPTYYWADGTGKEQQPYLEILSRELDKDVYLFWTGDAVVGKISRQGAETFRRISGHRLFLWDNYPVNDNNPTMHLGPVIDRDPDLCEVIDGYMSNPLCKQNQANRLPLLTCLDYAWNPADYDPFRSIGQAIAHLADTLPRQRVLKEMVEAYPGMLIYNSGSTGFNAVQEQYGRIAQLTHGRLAAQSFVDKLQALSASLHQEFPDRYRPEKETLDTDIQKLKKRFAAQYPDTR